MKNVDIEDDLESLLFKSHFDDWKIRVSKKGEPSLDNSKNQTNKQKNQDEDTKNLLTIYDLECYTEKTDEEFRRLNPVFIDRVKCTTTFEAFAKYAVYSDEYELCDKHIEIFDLVADRIKSDLKIKFPKSNASVKIYKSNRYNIFFMLQMISLYSFEFADHSALAAIPLGVLQQGVDASVEYLKDTNAKIKDLYNRKNKDYA